MTTLLSLVHRIPFPPNKGDKIRSYQLLRQLSSRYRVLLGAFVDYPEDWSQAAALDEFCDEVYLLPLRPRLARLRSLAGLWAREPLTVPYYRDRRMHRWARSKFEQGVDKVVVFSSSMAQYADYREAQDATRVIDFVDLDSEKWQQYGAHHSGLLGAVYRREARLLARYESEMARRFDHSVLVSSQEAKPLQHRCPELAGRIHAVPNGVDHRYFDPADSLVNPYGANERAVVFTGAMDYQANVDAVCWFAEHAWPRIHAANANYGFTIVGSRPERAVLALGRLPGIRVTGTVDDVRPYLKFASVAVAPMRIARGIQNKVLEAMAMGLPVVGTAAAVEGLSADVAACVEQAESGEQFAQAALKLLEAPPSPNRADRNRAAILRDYDWAENLSLIFDLLDGGSSAAAAPSTAPSSAAIAPADP